MYDSLPLVERDMYWNESEPQPPYTTASAEHRKPSFMGSALDIRFNEFFDFGSHFLNKTTLLIICLI